ncbi:hypothetical protein BpHYR1_040500 [Brachionus plicatilis]|uniref:Uncharacterized protein n=1 Tax=Brachionus plicatilis TaxID=10195 RepID=A0A3M7RJ53_BRAPC|nr:hypothetical protein BpHYR1_040500 [Brachionus plicatilis]
MKEYKNFAENVKKFYEQEKELIELLQSLIDYSRENLYHLAVHEFLKDKNDNIIIGNQSDDGRTLKMTSPMLLRLPTLINYTLRKLFQFIIL